MDTFSEYLEDMYKRIIKETEYKGTFEDFKKDFDIDMMYEDYEDSMGLPC